VSAGRIAVVAPGPAVAGGQSVQAQALVSALRAEGREVVFIPTDPPLPRSLRRVPVLRTLVNQALYLPRLARLAGVETALVFSASHWSFVLAPLPALVAARALGAGAVLVYHSGEAEEHLARWGAWLRPALALPHRIVVPSEFLREVFARHGYRASVIPNVVDTSAFRYRERVPVRPRLLSARNLEAHYGVDNTIRAFGVFRRRHPEATLTVAGDGRERPRLRSLVADLGVGGVRFAGATAPATMPRLYDEADVFLNSSTVDNQPVSLLEAFAAGIPVVSTSPGGIGWMVRDGETGTVVPPDDPAAMARAIENVIADPRRSAERARRAREMVERHTWPRVRDLWSEVARPGGHP
jgi:glycosyltransferase involved in cell wall biosynthesis